MHPVEEARPRVDVRRCKNPNWLTRETFGLRDHDDAFPGRVDVLCVMVL